jgi:hypothetical protein
MLRDLPEGTRLDQANREGMSNACLEPTAVDDSRRRDHRRITYTW